MTKIIVITGPTAVGKTAIALELAQKIDGEVVCCDSMQIYRGLDIGTAKPTKDERNTILHHCVDIIEPDAEFTVTDYIKYADKAIADIVARKKMPIICGGTGFYIKGLLFEQSYAGVKGDDELRNQLIAEFENYGAEHLYAKLANLDPETAIKIHQNDTKRVVRALEICILKGAKKSDQIDSGFCKRYDYTLIGVDMERGKLYERINQRVDKMITDGLENEVKSLIQYRDCQSMQAIGYKQFFDYFDKKISLEQTISLIKQKTRNYAKRQWTFLRALPDIRWLEDYDRIYKEVRNEMQ